MPMSDSVDLEPVIEPPPAPPPLVDSGTPVDWTAREVPVVPPAPALPLPEWTPGLIRPVALPGRPQPDYPPLARRTRVGGVVLLRAVITEEGEVAAIEVLGAPRPDLGFSAAAIEAVSAWRYEPGRYGGKPVAVDLTVRIEFTVH
jgi:TonB family protein